LDLNSATPGKPAAMPKPQALFRDEVLQSSRHQLFGSIKLNQSASWMLIVAVSALIAIALVLLIALGSYMKKARVTGITIPSGGIISVAAPANSVLQRELVPEGATVKAGQPIFELSTERFSSNGGLSGILAGQIKLKKSSLEAERLARTRDYQRSHQINAEKLQLADEQARELEKEIELTRRRMHFAEKSVEQYELLQKSNYVSAAQTQDKMADLLDMQARIATLERTRAQIQASRVSVLSDQKEVETTYQIAMAQMVNTEQQLAKELTENDTQKKIYVVAPQDGVVTTITNHVGQDVTAGQVLATIVPFDSQHRAAQMEVQLFAPSKTAGFIASGQNVHIRYHAFPYQKFGLYVGTVIDVSRTPLAPSELPANIASTVLSNAQEHVLGYNVNESLYRVRVKLAQQTVKVYGQELALKPGMTLEADVQQDRRKIWEWIAEPLLAW
jgi:membrane fusion protein